MTKTELANKLLASIDDMEHALVSDFNKTVLTELKEAGFTGDVDEKAVTRLEGMLQTFLKETWAEEPDAHKYVIASCIALALLFERPMHPQDKVGYITREENGKTKYYCPYNERGTLCDFCAAVPLQS